jgi:hypothetical protein
MHALAHGQTRGVSYRRKVCASMNRQGITFYCIRPSIREELGHSESLSGLGAGRMNAHGGSH